jgi:hypothetical protein
MHKPNMLLESDVQDELDWDPRSTTPASPSRPTAVTHQRVRTETITSDPLADDVTVGGVTDRQPALVECGEI